MAAGRISSTEEQRSSTVVNAVWFQRSGSNGLVPPAVNMERSVWSGEWQPGAEALREEGGGLEGRPGWVSEGSSRGWLSSACQCLQALSHDTCAVFQYPH